MFDEVYRIAIESNSFDELKRKLGGRDINAIALKDGLLVSAATQLAKEGNDEKVEWLGRLDANVKSIAYGYALAGNHERVEFYRAKDPATASVIARGYAQAGNHEQVELYRTKHRADVDDIACGYAQAGNHEQVELYRTKHRADVDDIASIYALAGNHKQVEVYRKEHKASVDAIASIYALAGNHKQVEVYRKEHKASVDAIAYGYTLAGNHEKQRKYDIRYLLSSYLKDRSAVTDSSGKPKTYYYGCFTIFQKSFTQKKAAVEALQSALNGDNVDLSKHLSTLRNGRLGKELRAFVKLGMGDNLVKLGMEDELVGEQVTVTTVSGFIQALQKKVSNQAQLSCKTKK